ncbi:MAG: thiamine pyrophosphate-dependent protein [Bacillota bacterium]|nr:MAG: thiamine pyrophosphate-dependent protein [Bacillota bacterium]
MKKLVAHQMTAYLEEKGVEYIFGLCGHTVIALLEALEKSSIKFVSVRHEQIAAHAADGYARVTGKPGVVLSHLGPGLTNATTGVANAALDSVPMVVIAGDVPSFYYGKHPHQEVNMHADAAQYEIYKPFVKRAWRVERPELMPEILDKAFALAVSGRPGPVLISVPMDMFSREIDTWHFDKRKSHNSFVHKPSLPPGVAEQIVGMLLEAEKPLIYVGGGVISSDASDELTELVDFLDIPVTRTLMGQGAISDLHPLCAGMTGFWGTELTNRLTREADVILAVGTRFSEADCSSWYEGVTFNIPPARLIHIDIDAAEIGRNFPVALGAVADAKAALTAILQAAKILKPEGVQNPALRSEIKACKEAFLVANEEVSTSDRFPMTPQRILADVREVLPEDGIVLTDVGWNKNGVGQQFPITMPKTILHPGGLATMGFGPAAVLGAKLGAPDKQVITLVGDGGFGTQPSVIATAVENNIPVVWVVMNNYAFGTIAGLQHRHYQTYFGTLFKRDGQPYNPEWAEVARAYGIKAKRISSAAEFKGALREALESGEPYLLDVPMENIPVPTDGVWNINDIYTPKDGVCEGRLIRIKL